MTAKTRAELEAQFTDQPFGSGGRKQIRAVDNGDLKDLLDSVPLATEGGAADFSAVAEDILPDADDTYDLGSAVVRWAEGHFSGFLAMGLPVAQSGVIRLANNAFITARNSDDDDDISLIGLNADDQTEFDNDLVPKTDQTYDFGSPSLRWQFGYFEDVVSTAAAFQAAQGDAISVLNTYSLSVNDGTHDIYVDASSEGIFSLTGLVSLGLASFPWGNIFATLPTANPNVAGQFWNDVGTVKVSAG